MNRQHFQTFVWLRWRILVNQLRRGGSVNAIILSLLAIGAVVLAVIMFVTFFLVGWFVLPGVSPLVLLYVWDGLIVAFLFSWTLGVVIELQRAEVLSLEKFLHLPVSLRSAFLINYLSSLFSISLIVFLPGMVALSLALVLTRGPALLVLFPLLAAFLLLVTALTYQFQGWLAALMVNQRRRRTVLVVVTAVFILVCQVPNLVNLLRPWENRQRAELTAHLHDQQNELRDAFMKGTLTPTQYEQQQDQLQREYQNQLHEMDAQLDRQVEQTARVVNLVLPFGWLPLGAMEAATGQVLPALLGVLGLTFLGTVSLWRSYRTTVRLYTGHFTSGQRQPVAVPSAVATKTGKPTTLLLEQRLPWLSEQTAAVALGGFRSLLRAPEAKMVLLSPFLMVLIFGSLFITHSLNIPEAFRPLLLYAAMSMVLFSLIQLVGNQFGFDRGGFRVFVLSGAPRRDILLGKNLSVAPLAFGLGGVMIVMVEIVSPVRLDFFLGALPQSVSMYLIFCLLANWMSIFAPLPIRSGSLKPANPKGLALLLQFLLVFLFPLALLPALLPLGLTLLGEALGWTSGVPLCLLLSLAECAVLVVVYYYVLTWQGTTLQAREQKILEIVTSKAE